VVIENVLCLHASLRDVEGKHTRKNVLVRSFAGVGEVAAALVGRGNLDQPLSEGDLLRERVSNNIGQASAQTVANLVLTEQIVVPVPADTEIYVHCAEDSQGKCPAATHSILISIRSGEH
jgi:hypothetical protein